MVNNNEWQSFGDLFEDYISDNNTGVCIKTGIKQVDDIMRIEKTSLTVIAGAKETGKTTLAMQMALHMAKQNLKVAFFTLKETKMQAAEIALANEIGVSMGDVENKIQGGNEFEAVKRVARLPMFLSEKVSEALHSENLNGVDVVFIDGFKELTKDAEGNDEISSMAIAVKEFAMKTEVPVVMTCELPAITRKYVPDLAYMGKYDELEYVSDSIILIGGENPTSVFYVAKNREGEAGLYFDIAFDKSKQRFLEVTT